METGLGGILFLGGTKHRVVLHLKVVEPNQSEVEQSLCSKLQVKSPCQTNDMGFKLEQEFYFLIGFAFRPINLSNKQLLIKFAAHFHVCKLNSCAAVFTVNNDPLLQLAALFVEY